MDKFSNRFIGVILLVAWSTLVCAGNWSPQHRSVDADTSDPGEIVFFILYVIVMEFGKKLDKNYRCPVYCGINHKHIYEIKESNIQAANRILRPGTPESGEQPETVLRTCPDVYRLCGDEEQIGEAE